ncbi:beta-2 adrenergic receptor-like [Anneissia japonica]|uniref:beta-2 adrenergic receptor-like n=1 Tax=Anneissia japonica TaxID=1529436 RepID=UPI0014259E88|nr:beta-2 adrenergic receptor-like [Anneissia japonica]
MADCTNNGSEEDPITAITHTTSEIVPASVTETWLTSAYIMIGTIGIAGNITVLYIFLRTPKLVSLSTYFLRNQSVIDLLSSILFLVLFLRPKNIFPNDNGFLSNMICKLWYSEYPFWALCVSSTVNIVCLTIERYLAVFKPVMYRSSFTKNKAIFLCCISWCIGPLHEIAWATAHHFENGTCVEKWDSRKVQVAIGSIVFTNHYVIPVSIMIYVYWKIIAYFQDVNKRRASNTTLRTVDAGIKRSQNVRKRIIKTAFLVSLAYILCWGPNEIFFLLGNFGIITSTNGVIFKITVICAACNMSLNPFLYALNCKCIRRRVLSNPKSKCTRSNLLIMYRYSNTDGSYN